MPGPRVTPVIGDEALPDRVDVVVIGGGIVGASTALELAERGLSVALCEKGGIGQEQSSRNWGWVRISRRSRREVPLMAEALKIWPQLNQRTGRDVGYRQNGIAFACHSDADIATYEQYDQDLIELNIGFDMLTPDRLSDLLPGYREKVKAVAYSAVDGSAEPQLAAPAIGEAARDRGATILTECAVRGIETAAGRVSGVVTERGPIACESVVLAGGAWSRLFSGNMGIDLPQLKVMNTVIRTEPLPGAPETAFWTKGVAFRKCGDGGYNIADGEYNVADIVPDSFRLATRYMPIFKRQWRDIKLRAGTRFATEAAYPRKWSLDETTPFENTRVLDPTPHRRSAMKAFRRAGEVFPVFQQARVAKCWGGLIDVTPDVVPVISAVDEVPGFFIATGFSGHGFGIAPGAGRLMADMVTGQTPCVDPHDFRLSRFHDGSPFILDGGF